MAFWQDSQAKSQSDSENNREKNCEDIILIDKRLSTRERWKKNKETEKTLENKTSHSSSLPAYTQWQHKSGSNDS